MMPLVEMMLARADEDKLEPEHPLRAKAKAFQASAGTVKKDGKTIVDTGFDMKTFLAAWREAIAAWCDYLGEKRT
jgi:hypothetical protein